MNSRLPFLVLLASGVGQAQSYAFTQFDFPGAASTSAVAINNNGQILGIYADSKGTLHCFLRGAGGDFTTVDPPAAGGSCAGLNNLGRIAGAYSDSTGLHGYVRDPAGRFTTFDIRQNGPGAYVGGINDRGEIVGSFAAPPEGGPGFLRNSTGALTDLTSWLGQIAPVAINNKGEIAGWSLYSSSLAAQHGFIRSPNGVYRQFDVPGTTSYTRIAAINNVGQVAGSMVGGPGFVSIPDGSVALLPGYAIGGLNDAGQIVGSVFTGTGYHAFIGTPGPGPAAPEIRTALPGVLPASGFGGGPHNQTIAPGIWIEIYGRNLAPVTRQWDASDFHDAIAPTSLDGVTVTIAGSPAYISYISPGQVNALVPAGVAPGKADVVLRTGSQTAAPYTVDVAASAPGILSFPPQLSPETSYVAAVFPDFQTYAVPPYSVDSSIPTRRPKPGDTIVFFGMGFGPVQPDVPIGRIAPGPAPLASTVEVKFSRTAGPISGKTVYAGLVPGTVGLYQFNVVVPDVPIIPVPTADDYVNVSVWVDGAPIPAIRSLYIPIEK